MGDRSIIGLDDPLFSTPKLDLTLKATSSSSKVTGVPDSGPTPWSFEEITEAADVLYGSVYPEARFKGIQRGDNRSWIGSPEGNPFRIGLLRALASLEGGSPDG